MAARNTNMDEKKKQSRKENIKENKNPIVLGGCVQLSKAGLKAVFPYFNQDA